MDTTNLCDVCRQGAANYFYVDPFHPMGVVNRQVCSRCKTLSPVQQDAFLLIDLLSRGEGKCQDCGGSATVVSDTPGPDRHVTCHMCESSRLKDYLANTTPEDRLLEHLFVMLGCQCEGCGIEPDLTWAFDNPIVDEPDPAERFAKNAREYLLREGWQMLDISPYCPACAARNSG